MLDLKIAEQELAPVKPLLQEARELTITSAKDIEEAGFALKKLSDTKKQIEDLRISMTKPLNESLRAINNFFKQFSDPVVDTDRELRGKIKVFNDEFQKKETVNKNDFAEMSLATRNKVSGVKLKKVWTFKVIDLNKVPMEHFVLDEVRIRNFIRAGVREIPGIEIYQDEQVSL